MCMYVTRGLTDGLTRGSYTVGQRLNHFCPAFGHMLPYAQVPRRLGAGGALTVLRFAPLRGCVRDWVFALKRACEPGSCKEGANCRTRDSKLEEGDFQEA
jgi:hypothetical protein